MRIQDIEAFLTLAKLKHFGRAADSLFITQPALTRRIKSLEAHLNCDLFVRSTRDVRLSKEGEAILEHWETAYVHITRGLDATKKVRSGVGVTISIGFCTYSCSTELSSFVGFLLKAVPGSHVIPEMHSNENMIEQVLIDELDFVLLESRYLHPKLNTVPIIALEFTLAVPDDHPLMALSEIRMKDLDGLECYTGNLGYWRRPWSEVESKLEHESVQLETKEVMSNNTDVMRKAVSNHAPALLPAREDFIPIKGMNARRIVDLDVPLQMFLAWRTSSTNSIVHSIAEQIQTIDFQSAVDTDILA